MGSVSRTINATANKITADSARSKKVDVSVPRGKSERAKYCLIVVFKNTTTCANLWPFKHYQIIGYSNMTNRSGDGRKSWTFIGQKPSLPNQTSSAGIDPVLKCVGKIIVNGAFESQRKGMRAHQEFALARPEVWNWAKTIIGVWL